MKYTPKKIPGRRWMSRAAVAIIIRTNENHHKELLMIKRAERIGDPWSGDMAFPGGKTSQEDPNAYQTALRELEEEIGLPADNLEDAGRLSDQLTKTHSGLRPLVVSSFVFKLSKETQFTLNHEVAETVWLPISHFKTPTNRQSMFWKVKGTQIKMPCYWYQNYRVWGLSLRMIDDLLDSHTNLL